MKISRCRCSTYLKFEAMEEIENLKIYVCSANPDVNNELRKGIESDLTFDGLFKIRETPKVLYRLLPIEYISINDGVMSDAAYLSCTTNMDNFIGRISGEYNNIACLKIMVNTPINCICVNDILSENNNEEEYILPRNTRLRLLQENTFSNDMEFDDLIITENMNTRIEELKEIYKINTITVYTMQIEDH